MNSVSKDAIKGVVLCPALFTIQIIHTESVWKRKIVIIIKKKIGSETWICLTLL